jgi:phosphohistidine phosphatase
MHFYLMRHAQAAAAGAAIDEERRLTPHGFFQTERLAAALQERELPVDRIVSSPYRRSQQTAKEVARVFGLENIETTAALGSSGSAPDVRPYLEETTYKGVLFVGHHPDLALLANHLGAPDISLAPAAAAIFEIATDEDPPTTRYLYLLDPEELLPR